MLEQEPAPGLNQPVGSDAQRAAFVSSDEEPEQQLGASVVEGREAEADDDRVVRSRVSMVLPTLLSASARKRVSTRSAAAK